MLLKQGQIITLNMRVNNSGTILRGHPYLVLSTEEDNNIVEIAQVDSLAGKEFKAFKKSNKVIYCDNPIETVIDKDSYIQLDNSLRIEYFDELTLLRRQEDVLSQEKLNDVANKYTEYQRTNPIEDDKKVYLTKEELITLNNKLK